MKRLIELIRKRNRARLERRAQLKACGGLPRGWFPRLVYRLKARNHDRLAQRRLRKHLLASLAANDTAVLEALVFILRTSRQDQRARAEVDEAIAKRLAALEERLDAGLRLVSARLETLDERLAATQAKGSPERSPVVGLARQRAPEPGGNGSRQNGQARAELDTDGLERSAGVDAAPAEGERAAIAAAPKRERF